MHQKIGKQKHQVNKNCFSWVKEVWV